MVANTDTWWMEVVGDNGQVAKLVVEVFQMDHGIKCASRNKLTAPQI